MSCENLAEVPDLEKKILELLLEIPDGMVTTYKDIAIALGDPNAARAVGTVMANNQDPDKYPCWRVVYSSGKVGNYSAPGGKKEKIAKMERDGITVLEGSIENFSEVRYDDFDIEPPLPELREVQGKIEGMVNQEHVEPPESVAGVDVSYGAKGVVASYIEMSIPDGGVEYENYIFEERAKFPYIPGYLAFRELPFLIRLLGKVENKRELADVIFVDGNGLLHPRKAGLASHLGVVVNHPTIGVAKRLLCGETEDGELSKGEIRDVELGGKRIGLEVRTSARAKPIYVSVGNRIDLDQAADLTMGWSNYKLPEPLRQAHKSAKSRAT